MKSKELRDSELNIEFMEENVYLARWLIEYCNKNHIEPPNLDKLQELIKRSQEIVSKMNQPYRPDGDLTEPVFVIVCRGSSKARRSHNF
jgi:hypothetical protein